ncbi:MAG: tRNA (adenosine(37)-N6)-threonylcarbamoyltransferase complex ATPase subunit type 1 TsaE [Burkholderiales bacterium]
MPDAAATLRLGEALVQGRDRDALRGMVLHLGGDLGSGKTTLVRGLLRALGYPGPVKSPSYTLLEPYAISSLNLYHFDFYRFKDPSEWQSSGFREYFGRDAFCVVEWPERAGSLIAAPDLEVRLAYRGDGRDATLTAHSAAGKAWLEAACSRLRFS